MNPTDYDYDFDDSLPAVCIEYDVGKVLFHFALYGVLSWLTLNYKKRHVLASHIVSMLVCWHFMYSKDVSNIVAYYWYDMVIALYNKDVIMILHHIASLGTLQLCPWHPDHARIASAVVSLKISDIVLHIYKITDSLEMYDKYPNTIKITQIITTLITIVLWLYFRVYLTSLLFPFYSDVIQVVAGIFWLVNVYWIHKLYKLAVNIFNDLFSVTGRKMHIV